MGTVGRLTLLTLSCLAGLSRMALGGAPSGAAPPGDAELAASARHFHVTGTHTIGGEGSWDYADYDASRQRLFVSRVGGILVLDTQTMKPVASIPALAGTRTHGIAFATDLGVGMTSEGSDGTSTVFDLATLKPLRRVQLGHSPDSIIYDPASHRAVGFDGDDQVAVAFDSMAGTITAQIKLPGSPEAAAVDALGHIYVNLSNKAEVAVIDTQHWAVQRHWSIGGGCEEPTPLGIDREHLRLFIGCRSGVLAIVDPLKQSLVATVPIGKGADAVAYESKSHLIFVSCYDGTLTVIEAGSLSDYHVLQIVTTAPAARTLALDPVGPRVFLPVADLGPALPKVGDIPGRPAVIPGTFRILTVAR